VLDCAQERGGVTPSFFGHPAAVLAVAFVAAVLLAALWMGTAHAQSPTPGLLPPTDPRSEGAGPGFGSGPVIAALMVIALGVLAAGAVFAYAKLARRR
jgi:hypothetical protein